MSHAAPLGDHRVGSATDINLNLLLTPVWPHQSAWGAGVFRHLKHSVQIGQDDIPLAIAS